MNNVFDAIQLSAKALKIDAYATDVAVFAEEKEFNKEQLEAIHGYPGILFQALL